MTVGLLPAVCAYLNALPDREKEEIMNELAAHLEDKTAALRAQGQSPAQAEANARSSFGDPASVGRRLADIHNRPSRRESLLAILPFLISGVVFSIVVLGIVALDKFLGPMPDKVMRIMGLRLYHVETSILFGLLVVGVSGLLCLGALVAILRDLPLWSAAWVGSAALVSIAFLQLLLDEAEEATVVLANLALIAVLMFALIVLARLRSSMLAVLIALTIMLQGGIFAAYALSTPPLNLAALSLVLALAVSAVSCLAVLGVLHTGREQQGAIVIMAALLSAIPYTVQQVWYLDAGLIAWRLVSNIILLTILLMLIPYLLGRRQPSPD